MNYAPFELTSQQKSEKEFQRVHINNVRNSYIENYVKTNNLVRLKSDYLDMSQFFYYPKNKTILQVQSFGNEDTPNFYVPKSIVFSTY